LKIKAVIIKNPPSLSAGIRPILEIQMGNDMKKIFSSEVPGMLPAFYPPG
jgi:hypothetical protein